MQGWQLCALWAGGPVYLQPLWLVTGSTCHQSSMNTIHKAAIFTSHAFSTQCLEVQVVLTTHMQQKKVTVTAMYYIRSSKEVILVIQFLKPPPNTKRGRCLEGQWLQQASLPFILYDCMFALQQHCVRDVLVESECVSSKLCVILVPTFSYSLINRGMWKGHR